MNRMPFVFFPVSFFFFAILFFIIFFLFIFVYIGMIGSAFDKLGISPFIALTILFTSIWGSTVNIPVKVLSEESVVSGEVVSFFGMRYIIPVLKEGNRTVLAVNLGGAVIPVLVSLYLVSRIGVSFSLLIATVLMTLIVYKLAKPVRGLGIAMPTFIPPILSALVSLLLAPDQAAPIAYISGTVGTLVGADILNLSKIPGLGAPVASIGGAGTFDGIFLTGILAVILA